MFLTSINTDITAESADREPADISIAINFDFSLHGCTQTGPFLFIDINSMPHYIVILHDLHNLSFSFTITFIFNNHKIIVEIRYIFDNNIFYI